MTRRCWASRWMVGMAAAMALVATHTAGAEDAKPVGPEAADALALLGSGDAYERQKGFLRLEALRDPGTVDAIRPYVDSKDPELRAYSLRALAAIDGVHAAPLLLERLRTDKHPRVRRAALLGLEPLAGSDPHILPALIAALRDRKPEVRMAAIDIVSRIDDQRAREAIVLRARRERDRDVRRVLALAAKRMGTR